MTTSRVPAAVEALLALCNAASALDDVEVLDGPPTNDLTSLDRLHIGYQPGQDTAVELAQNFNGAGARTRDEDFSIRCWAESRAGGVDMAARRARVFAIVAAVETALRATDAATNAPTLSGTVLWSHLTTGDLAQEQTDDGAGAGLAFAVECRARI
jgi:hypothetical protein